MEIESKKVLYYHQSCPNLMDPEICSNVAIELYVDLLVFAKKLHSIRLDEVEIASMFQIIALKEGNRMFLIIISIL